MAIKGDLKKFSKRDCRIMGTLLNYRVMGTLLKYRVMGMLLNCGVMGTLLNYRIMGMLLNWSRIAFELIIGGANSVSDEVKILGDP